MGAKAKRKSLLYLPGISENEKVFGIGLRTPL